MRPALASRGTTGVAGVEGRERQGEKAARTKGEEGRGSHGGATARAKQPLATCARRRDQRGDCTARSAVGTGGGGGG